MTTSPTTQVINPNNVSFPKRSYTLYYHFRSTAPLTLTFEFTGSFNQAIERAQTFCKRCNYRFIKIRPFIVDLDKHEELVNSRSDNYMDDI